MATFREQRTHDRVQCRFPLELKRVVRQDESPCGAIAFNMSESGVYLETDERIEPGEMVHIHPTQLMPRILERSRFCDSTGVIRWCRPVNTGRHRSYGAGIRLSLPRSGEEALECRPGVIYSCDMCGASIGLWDVRGQRGPAWLCEHCRSRLNRYPDAVRRPAVRFLIGNAL
ncbi:MAG: hypothetical protein GXY28_09220 [Bacteriovoracaceae bacterium]|nr:hypothetical protein [Bacteriovoracaceae bacterium]HRR22698.1 PilZ domain-containing protein [Desulfomonilia bacterium]HRT45870.1 PilZ domain-containing protein [Desulfomonilia bacterium]